LKLDEVGEVTALEAAVTVAAAPDLHLFHQPLVRAIFKGRELLFGAAPDDRPRPRGLLASVHCTPEGSLIARQKAIEVDAHGRESDILNQRRGVLRQLGDRLIEPRQSIHRYLNGNSETECPGAPLCNRNRSLRHPR
jgi:hypothetical protein